MRKSLIAVALVAGLGLGGCATNPITGTTTVDTTQITAIEAQVQQTAAAVCGFVPTLGTVASVIATFAGGGPIVSIVNQVASSICHAVTPAKAALRSARRDTPAPMVNGVPIQGYFIR